ncbi:MAG: winged helix-turn-helix transcriptional regulator [Candidatus Nanoarchaeia archaeon]
MQLDLKDRKILYELDKNSRLSYSQLAKKVRLSKDVVQYRVKRLESEGFILGYQSIIDFTKLGYFALRLQFSLFETTPSEEQEMVNFLVKQKEVFLVSESEGDVHITVGLLLQNISQLKKFQISFENKFKKNIKKFIISAYQEVYHFNRKYFLETVSIEELKISVDTTIKDIDENDLKIIKILTKNSRTSIVEISSKLNMNANTVAFRIKKLEKEKIILGHKILFGFKKVNYVYIKTDLFLKNVQNEKKILEFCRQQKNIIYVSKTIGGSDLEIYFEIENVERFLEIMKILREEFKEIVDWKYNVFSKYHKFNYFID